MSSENLQELKELGLTIINDFITEDESFDILSNITFSDTIKLNKQRNSIKRYGSNKPYNNCIVSKDIPPFLDNVSEKLVSSKLLDIKPDSITVNEYRKGQGIPCHIDSLSSGKVITILSLKSPAVMCLELNLRKELVELLPNSLIQMRNEIRLKWMHGIIPVSEDRISIVFRQGQHFG